MSLARISVFASILLPVLWILSDPWVRNSNPIMTERYVVLETASYKTADALTIASSHAVAVDFNIVGINGIHMWVPGADLFETRKLLSELYKKGAKPRWLLIILNPFILMQENGLMHDLANLAPVNSLSRDYSYRLLRIFALDAVINHDYLGWLRANFFPLRADGKQSFGFVRTFRCDVLNNGVCAKFHFEFTQEPDPVSKKHLDAMMDLHSPLWINSLAADQSITERTQSELGRIFEIAQFHHSRLVITAAPLTYAYVKRMSIHLQSNQVTKGISLSSLQKSALRNLAQVNPYVIDQDLLWNLNSDGRRAEWFSDAIHLNRAGAAEYSRRLKKQIVRICEKIEPDCEFSRTPSPALSSASH